MARKIAPTPILTGKAAEKFLEDIENPKKISEEEWKRIEESYNRVKATNPDLK